jgi:hypothetical protein
MFVCCECCVLSGRGLCDELITRPEESYRLWRVVVCDLEISWTRRPWPAVGLQSHENKQTRYGWGEWGWWQLCTVIYILSMKQAVKSRKEFNEEAGLISFTRYGWGE